MYLRGNKCGDLGIYDKKESIMENYFVYSLTIN